MTEAPDSATAQVAQSEWPVMVVPKIVVLAENASLELQENVPRETTQERRNMDAREVHASREAREDLEMQGCPIENSTNDVETLVLSVRPAPDPGPLFGCCC